MQQTEQPLSLAALNRDLDAAKKRAAKRERKRGWLRDCEWPEGDEYEISDESKGDTHDGID